VRSRHDRPWVADTPAQRFTGRFAFSGLPQKEAPDEHQGAPDKEADIPVNPLVPGDSFVDVVNAKQLMVHDALSKIENAEAHQQRPGEQPAGPPHVSPMCGPPQQGKSGNDKNVSAGVEDTVEKRVQLKVIDAVGGIPGACDHVVPLKQLMEDDPVKETSQPPAEKDACRSRKPPVLTFILSHSVHPMRGVPPSPVRQSWPRSRRSANARRPVTAMKSCELAAASNGQRHWWLLFETRGICLAVHRD